MFKIENQSEEIIIASLQDKNQCKLITHIHFAPTVSPKVNLTKIINILNNRCTNIEKADLYAAHITEENVASFVKNRTNLNHLQLTCPISDACLTFISLTCKLNYLSLLDDYLVTDEGMETLLSNNPQLTQLNLRGCSRLNGNFLKFLSKDVTELRITNTNIDINLLKNYITKFTKLIDLRIGNGKNFFLFFKFFSNFIVF
jgi:hypothetical protein